MVPAPHYAREKGINNDIQILHLLKDEYFIYKSKNQACVSKCKIILVEIEMKMHVIALYRSIISYLYIIYRPYLTFN